MYIFEASKLRAGDIIFTRDKSSSTSWLIRLGTFSEYSHAILYVGGSSFIDSDIEGVHSNNLQRLIFASPDDAIVTRYKGLLSASDVQTICDYVREQIGQRYSKKEAVRTALPLSNKVVTGKQFCSRLVAQAYAAAGFPLVDDSDFCSPGQLIESTLLKEVKDVSREASALEIELAEHANRNPLKKQEEITNDLLEKVREISSMDTSTISDMFHIAASNPEFDPLIADALSSSGYLTMWQWDMQRNPYWYDIDIFRASIPEPEWKSTAEEMIAPAQDALRRFQKNLVSIENRNRAWPSLTGILMAELERNLCAITHQRITVLEAFV